MGVTVATNITTLLVSKIKNWTAFPLHAAVFILGLERVNVIQVSGLDLDNSGSSNLIIKSHFAFLATSFALVARLGINFGTFLELN